MSDDLVPLRVAGVRVQFPSGVPVVLLLSEEQERLLPVFIGHPEAAAISLAIDNEKPSRPLTHDLMMTLISQFGGIVERVVVTELIDGTYYAQLTLSTREGPITLSCRPSDAIALALRASATIFTTQHLLDEAGTPIPIDLWDPQDDPADENVDDDNYGSSRTDSTQGSEELGDTLERFREFLEDVDPDDFLP